MSDARQEAAYPRGTVEWLLDCVESSMFDVSAAFRRLGGC